VSEHDAITNVGQVIQLALAPVFLLSGIAGMLAVMTNRLSRVIDRARQVEGLLPSTSGPQLPLLHSELGALCRRAKLTYTGILLCTITALCVSAVVGALFLGAFFEFNARIPVALLFVAGMATFFAALLCFLREVFIATSGLRIGPR
jgi:hypothetical protein